MAGILRYVGVAKESIFGTKVAPKFFLDPAASTLDTPDTPDLIKPGGLTRFQRRHRAGMYIPAGNLNVVADPPIIYYLLWLLLGEKTTTDNTSEVTDEATPSDANGVIDVTLANQPVVPGTVIIENDTPTQEAHDDGYGNIVEDASSGITGTIDYDTGKMKCTGATVSHAYTTTYDKDTFEHKLTMGNVDEMLSATLKLGKDQFMHTFVGCALSQVTLTIEREWVMATFDVFGQKDEKETLLTLANVTIPQGYALPFHKVTAKICDYGGTLADYSVEVERLELVINAAADAEGGVTIGSRHPRRIWTGEAEITGSMSLRFDGTDELEDFWGGTTGPTGDVQEKALQIKLDGGNLGDVTFDLYKIISETLSLQPSGRARLIQELGFRALFDDSQEEIVLATCNSVYNWA